MIKHIKFSLFAVVIATFLFLGSCVNEDKPSGSSIVGTWNFDSYSLLNASINGQPALTFMTTVMGMTAQQAEVAQALFLSGIVNQEELEETTFTFNGDGTYVVNIDGVEEDSGTYSLQNNNTKLVLNSVNGDQEYDIFELTNNRLALVLDTIEEYDVTGDGTDEEIEFAMEVVLVK